MVFTDTDCPPCRRALAGIVPTVTLSFRTNPKGADVLVDGVKIGTTPLTREFPAAGKPMTFMLAKAGYVSAVYTFPPRSNGYVWAKLEPVKLGSPPTVPATFSTDEPNLGGFPVSLVVMGVLGLGVVGYLGYRVVRGR